MSNLLLKAKSDMRGAAERGSSIENRDFTQCQRKKAAMQHPQIGRLPSPAN
jgi:hypothetical protein